MLLLYCGSFELKANNFHLTFIMKHIHIKPHKDNEILLLLIQITHQQNGRTIELTGGALRSIWLRLWLMYLVWWGEKLSTKQCFKQSPVTTYYCFCFILTIYFIPHHQTQSLCLASKIWCFCLLNMILNLLSILLLLLRVVYKCVMGNIFSKRERIN